MKKVVFVCVENSCRSQIAEAFANIHGQGVIDAYSAGSRPSGKVNEKAVNSMKETGYDLDKHESKSLDDLPGMEYDFAITMGCGDECPYIQAKYRKDWGIPDPKNLNAEEFRRVRELIEEKVLLLIEEIKESQEVSA
ncbi:MAG: arsenate reductase ArsC [Nitrospirota bacterium]|nr:arsenate reductase ArsC [Nitrospirota bacterium]